MPKLLTIAIPVYNTEQYLDECLSSVLTEHGSALVEVLAINDGSTDNSARLLNAYAERFPEIVRVIHKENGGWGTCINLAIAQARGTYFRILDSDDWVAQGSLARLLEVLAEQEADLVVTEMTEHFPQGEPVHHSFNKEFLGSWKYTDYLAAGGKAFPMHCFCCRTSLLREAGVQVPDRYYGDLDYNLKVHSFAQSVYVTALDFFQYRRGLGEQSTSAASYARHKSEHMAVVESLVRFYEQQRSAMHADVERIYLENLKQQLRFCYRLHLSPVYSRREDAAALRAFDAHLRVLSPEMHRWTASCTVMKFVPFVWLWRYMGMNILRIR